MVVKAWFSKSQGHMEANPAKNRQFWIQPTGEIGILEFLSRNPGGLLAPSQGLAQRASLPSSVALFDRAQRIEFGLGLPHEALEFRQLLGYQHDPGFSEVIALQGHVDGPGASVAAVSGDG